MTGNNLLNVSKLIFSISRCEQNDKLFDKEEMIQPIVKLLGVIELSDALVYMLGAVKLLAGNVSLRAKLIACGVINCLVVVLEKITEVCVCVCVCVVCMCVCTCTHMWNVYMCIRMLHLCVCAVCMYSRMFIPLLLYTLLFTAIKITLTCLFSFGAASSNIKKLV